MHNSCTILLHPFFLHTYCYLLQALIFRDGFFWQAFWWRVKWGMSWNVCSESHAWHCFYWEGIFWNKSWAVRFKSLPMICDHYSIVIWWRNPWQLQLIRLERKDLWLILWQVIDWEEFYNNWEQEIFQHWSSFYESYNTYAATNQKYIYGSELCCKTHGGNTPESGSKLPNSDCVSVYHCKGGVWTIKHGSKVIHYI